MDQLAQLIICIPNDSIIIASTSAPMPFMATCMLPRCPLADYQHWRPTKMNSGRSKLLSHHLKFSIVAERENDSKSCVLDFQFDPSVMSPRFPTKSIGYFFPSHGNSNCPQLYIFSFDSLTGRRVVSSTNLCPRLAPSPSPRLRTSSPPLPLRCSLQRRECNRCFLMCIDGGHYSLRSPLRHICLYLTRVTLKTDERSRNQFDTPCAGVSLAASGQALQPPRLTSISFCAFEIRGGKIFLFYRAAFAVKVATFLDSRPSCRRDDSGPNQAWCFYWCWNTVKLPPVTSEPWHRWGIFIHKAASIRTFCLFQSIGGFLKMTWIFNPNLIDLCS